MESLSSLPDSLGALDILLSDAGYFSQNNAEECKGNKSVFSIASERQQHNDPGIVHQQENPFWRKSRHLER
jgi:hypothetical protein